MALTFYHPFFDKDSLLDFGGLLDRPLRSSERESSLDIDIEENSDAYSVSADLPGLGEEDVKLEVHQGVLSIAAEKKVETQTKGKDGQPITISRTTRSFNRSFKLPEDVDEKGISAKMDKGVLALNLPKRPKAAPRRITITSAGSKL